MNANSAEFQETSSLAEAVEHQEPELRVEALVAQFQEKLDNALQDLAKEDPAAADSEKNPRNNPTAFAALQGLEAAVGGLDFRSPEERQDFAAAAGTQAMKDLNQAIGLAEPDPQDPAAVGYQFLEKAIVKSLAEDPAATERISLESTYQTQKLMLRWEQRGYEQPLDYDFLTEIQQSKDSKLLCHGALLITAQNFPSTMETLGLNPATGLEFYKDPETNSIIPRIDGNEDPALNQVIFESYSQLISGAWDQEPKTFENGIKEQPYLDQSMDNYINGHQVSDHPKTARDIYVVASMFKTFAENRGPAAFAQGVLGNPVPGRI